MGNHGYPQRVYGRSTDPDDGTYPVIVMESYWGDPDSPPPDTELIVAIAERSARTARPPRHLYEGIACGCYQFAAPTPPTPESQTNERKS